MNAYAGSDDIPELSFTKRIADFTLNEFLNAKWHAGKFGMLFVQQDELQFPIHNVC